ncbi:alpha/beta hydrolase family protein, partial [Bacteroidota bacterium]
SVDFWTEKADFAITEAIGHQDSGNIIASRESYLKASYYFRNAEYFENPFSLNYKSVGLKCRDAFWTACFMFDIPVEIADIPYNNTPIPGYFMKSHDNPGKEKTIIVTGGLHTSAEDLFMIFAPIAMKRGYHLLVYDGPGQTGMQRYFPELTFRPDYEYPVKAAIDYILERTDVDMRSLSLIGLGVGGYAGIRGAMHDKRIKSVVLNPPIINLYNYFKSKIGEGLMDLDLPYSDLLSFSSDQISEGKFLFLASTLNKFGAKSTAEFSKILKDYTISDTMLKRINCPVLCLNCTDTNEDILLQSKELEKALPEKTTVTSYNLCDQSNADTQINNINEIIFDWLDGLNL